MNKEKRGIIISRTDKIGDLILSIPAFYTAKKMFSDRKIAVLVRSYNAGIVKNLSFIDEVWIKDSEPFSLLKKRMKEFNAEIFAALFSDTFTLKAAFFSGAKIRVGPLSKPLSWLIYNRGIVQKRSRSVKNEAEYNLDIIKHIDEKLFNECYSGGYKIQCSEENKKNAEKYLNDNNIHKPYILIHPFAGGSAKNFTDKEYGDLIKKVSSMLPKTDIIITSSQEDSEKLKNLNKYISKSNVHIYINGNDILDLAALIENAEVYSGGSTGPSHIAGNMKKKAVLIYPAKASQSPVRWGLFGDGRAEYIIPDENNPYEDYSKKVFDNITEEVINRTAERIALKFSELE